MVNSMVFLKREGNKIRYTDLIIPLFPPHITYVEPFFGTGAIFWKKDLAKYNFINDIDSFIYELWYTLQKKENIDKLIKEINELLIYEKILKEQNSLASKVLLLRATLFVKGSSIKTCHSNDKKILLEDLEKFKNIYFKKLENAVIFNKDVFLFIKSISFGGKTATYSTFFYCDPPYAGTTTGLKSNKNWEKEDLKKLIELLLEKKALFAISEYESEFIKELANTYGLHINHIRDSLFSKNNSVEILLTNYPASPQKCLFE